MEKTLLEKAASSLASKAGKKKLRMTIDPTDNEGYHVGHEELEDGMNTGKKASHVFETLKGVQDHIDKQYGKKGSAWENERSDKEAQPSGVALDKKDG